MPSLCGYTWPDSLDLIIREEAQAAGLPLDLAYAFIAVESAFDPTAHALTDLEDSVGLLQLNRRGGQGAGFSVEDLQDPRTNLRLGLPHIRQAFDAVWSPDIDPFEFIYQVATRSGHPGPVPRGDARILRLAQVWSCFFPAAGNLYLGPGAAQGARPGAALSLVELPALAILLPVLVLIGAAVGVEEVGEEVLGIAKLKRSLSAPPSSASPPLASPARALFARVRRRPPTRRRPQV